MKPGRETDQLAQAGGQCLEFGISSRSPSWDAEADAVLLDLTLIGGHLALGDGPLHQKPGGDLHQACRQPHALARIGDA